MEKYAWTAQIKKGKKDEYRKDVMDMTFDPVTGAQSRLVKVFSLD